MLGFGDFYSLVSDLFRNLGLLFWNKSFRQSYCHFKWLRTNTIYSYFSNGIFYYRYYFIGHFQLSYNWMMCSWKINKNWIQIDVIFVAYCFDSFLTRKLDLWLSGSFSIHNDNLQFSPQRCLHSITSKPAFSLKTFKFLKVLHRHKRFWSRWFPTWSQKYKIENGKSNMPYNYQLNFVYLRMKPVGI